MDPFPPNTTAGSNLTYDYNTSQIVAFGANVTYSCMMDEDGNTQLYFDHDHDAAEITIQCLVTGEWERNPLLESTFCVGEKGDYNEIKESA